jgi:hypothetical protein
VGPKLPHSTHAVPIDQVSWHRAVRPSPRCVMLSVCWVIRLLCYPRPPKHCLSMRGMEFFLLSVVHSSATQLHVVMVPLVTPVDTCAWTCVVVGCRCWLCCCSCRLWWCLVCLALALVVPFLVALVVVVVINIMHHAFCTSHVFFTEGYPLCQAQVLWSPHWATLSRPIDIRWSAFSIACSASMADFLSTSQLFCPLSSGWMQ